MSFEEVRHLARLDGSELWYRYFALGGTATPIELDAILQGLMVPDPIQAEILTHALNERLEEIGEERRKPYPGERPSLSTGDDRPDE